MSRASELLHMMEGASTFPVTEKNGENLDSNVLDVFTDIAQALPKPMKDNGNVKAVTQWVLDRLQHKLDTEPGFEAKLRTMMAKGHVTWGKGRTVSGYELERNAQQLFTPYANYVAQDVALKGTASGVTRREKQTAAQHAVSHQKTQPVGRKKRSFDTDDTDTRHTDPGRGGQGAGVIHGGRHDTAEEQMEANGLLSNIYKGLLHYRNKRSQLSPESYESYMTMLLIEEKMENVFPKSQLRHFDEVQKVIRAAEKAGIDYRSKIKFLNWVRDTSYKFGNSKIEWTRHLGEEVEKIRARMGKNIAKVREGEFE